MILELALVTVLFNLGEDLVQASSIEEDGEGGEDSDSGDIKGGTPLEDENEIETE